MNTVEEYPDANVLEWISTQFSEHATIKTSDTKRTRFVSMPQIGMSGMHHVRVHVTVKIAFDKR